MKSADSFSPTGTCDTFLEELLYPGEVEISCIKNTVGDFSIVDKYYMNTYNVNTLQINEERYICLHEKSLKSLFN